MRYVRRKKPMMKTITDVVFCVAMTQYYMDEQIFVEILIVSLEKKGRHRRITSDSRRIGNENLSQMMLFNDRISCVHFPKQMSRTYARVDVECWFDSASTRVSSNRK